MQRATGTAIPAEARRSCAHPTHVAGLLADQPPFEPISRRDLMTAVNLAARDLGLRPTNVVVLDALLSCLPCRDQHASDAPITPRILLTIFASNETLCFRAKGITDRQLRRHLRVLEDLALIRRRDSSNGKRYPIHRAGRVVGAFGIDLTPLLLRAHEITALAKARTEADQELRGLRSQIGKLRAECLRYELSDKVRDFVESVQAVIRRSSTTVSQASAVLDELARVLSSLTHPSKAPTRQSGSDTRAYSEQAMRPAPAPERTTASDGQYVRHKEPKISDSKKEAPRRKPPAWVELPTISALFPEPPRNSRETLAVIGQLTAMLRIRPALVEALVSKLGIGQSLAILDRIAGAVETIASPNGYLRGILKLESRTPRIAGGVPNWPRL